MRLRKVFEYITDATRQQKETIKAWAKKANLDGDELITKVESLAEGDNAKQVAFAKWICNGTTNQDILTQAYNICTIKKLNPLKQNPESLVSENTDMGKDSNAEYKKAVSALIKGKKRIEENDGAYSYEVTEDDIQLVRDVVNAYWGVDSQPWCLVHATDGEVDGRGYTMWDKYDAYPKRVVFYGDKLLAFSAGNDYNYREYWDMYDRSFKFAPVMGITWTNNGKVFKILKSRDVVFTIEGENPNQAVHHTAKKKYSSDIERAEHNLSFPPEFKEGKVEYNWYGYGDESFDAERINDKEVRLTSPLNGNVFVFTNEGTKAETLLHQGKAVIHTWYDAEENPTRIEKVEGNRKEVATYNTDKSRVSETYENDELVAMCKYNSNGKKVYDKHVRPNGGYSIGELYNDGTYKTSAYRENGTLEFENIRAKDGTRVITHYNEQEKLTSLESYNGDGDYIKVVTYNPDTGEVIKEETFN